MDKTSWERREDVGGRFGLEVGDGLDEMKQVGGVAPLVYRTYFLFQDRIVEVDSSEWKGFI